MVTLKKMMGYVLLGMALYFMEVFLDARSMSIAWGLYLVVAGSLIGAFVSLNWEDPWWKKIARGLGIVIFLWGLIKIFQYPGTSFIAPNEKSSQNSSQGFYENHENTLREALKQKKPVFLYFGAKWCIPCKRIKEVVLKDSRIKKELQRFVVGVLDCTMADSHGAEIKKEVYNSPSMPFFAFHASDGTHLKDLDIHKAVEAEELLTVLQKVR